MKNIVSAVLTLSIAAAVLSGCGSKTVGKDSGNSSSPVTSSAPASSTAPAVQGSTVRERDIISDNDLFDYEIYQGCATVTKYKGSGPRAEVPAQLGGAPVTGIGFYCFEAKYSLKEVVLPDTLTTIGQFAFSDCDSLVSVNIPDGVKEIQRGAFAACTSLTSISLPASVETVKEEAFTACTSLASLYIAGNQLQYENWGLEDLANLTVYAASGSAAETWASAMGKFSAV